MVILFLSFVGVVGLSVGGAHGGSFLLGGRGFFFLRWSRHLRFGGLQVFWSMGYLDITWEPRFVNTEDKSDGSPVGFWGLVLINILRWKPDSCSSIEDSLESVKLFFFESDGVFVEDLGDSHLDDLLLSVLTFLALKLFNSGIWGIHSYYCSILQGVCLVGSFE